MEVRSECIASKREALYFCPSTDSSSQWRGIQEGADKSVSSLAFLRMNVSTVSFLEMISLARAALKACSFSLIWRMAIAPVFPSC
ncbi:hypothetical protein [Nostoc sp.]|uniref:hypothetical protein n=1 Tax=Nostoc sp. TaxID=1180 RepID=UPI002FF9202A